MSGTIVAQRGREASKRAIQLVWDDASSQVTVTPRDKDRFTIRMRAAVDALQKSKQVEEFSSQFQLLLSILAGWLREHKHSVREGYITLRDGALACVVIRSECEYDDDFEDALSELDLAIANDVDLALITMNVQALPPLSDDCLSSFVDPRVLLMYSPHAN